MGTPGTFVLDSEGRRKLCSNGKFAIFDASGVSTCCSAAGPNPCGPCCNWYDGMPISVSWSVTFSGFTAVLDGPCGPDAGCVKSTAEIMALYNATYSGTTTFKYYGPDYFYSGSPRIVIPDEQCGGPWTQVGSPPTYLDTYACFGLEINSCSPLTIRVGAGIAIFCGMIYVSDADRYQTVHIAANTPVPELPATCCGFSVDETWTDRTINIINCGSGNNLVATGGTMTLTATGTFSQGAFGKCFQAGGFGGSCIDGEADCTGACV